MIFISLYGLSKSRIESPAPFANNKAGEGADDDNDVDTSSKYSAFGGSASVAVTKANCPAESPDTTGGTSSALVLSDPNFILTSGVGGENGKNTNNKNKNIRDQQVSNTRDNVSCEMQEIDRYQGTTDPI